MFRRIPFMKGGSYSGKVLGTAAANLIGYWPMWETAGAVADNLEGTAARDGAYTGVTLANSTGPDGQPVGLWDGVNDYCNIYSTSLRDVFNGDEGTMSIWVKARNAAVWDDSAFRRFFMLKADANNEYMFLKHGNVTPGSQIYNSMRAGANTELVLHPTASTAWFNMISTWSKSGNAVKLFIDGVQSGSTQSGLESWAGNLASETVVIGASNNSASDPWNGWLAHAAIWTTPLSDGQVLSVATV